MEENERKMGRQEARRDVTPDGLGPPRLLEGGAEACGADKLVLRLALQLKDIFNINARNPAVRCVPSTAC
jgi:hypothetical protein